MKRHSLPMLLLLLAASPAGAVEADAAASYAADKKLCAEEATSSVRMQCLRDARAEYDKALTAAAKKSPPATACADCGQVLSVKVGEKKGEGGALGLIGGGVAGAVLGHQVGGGRGNDLATIAGAAGGAYAGHKIEENVKATKQWSVRVHLDGGEERTFKFDHDPGLAAGDMVKLSGSSIIRR